MNKLRVETFNNKPLYLKYCSTANDNFGAYRHSFDKEIKNLYYREQILTS
ncbi:MAG: DUF3347 domain-containing protein [Flavobacteriaceae bacterium]|nr:DUF3347 domain-containing protein [Flavobacteriaceae bacterium]